MFKTKRIHVHFIHISFLLNYFKDTANCKGILKLYPLDKSSKNLHMRVVMRIFNVDRINPPIYHHSILAVNRNTQTDWCRMDQKVQIGVTVRHAAVQVKNSKKKIFFFTI